MGIKVPEWLHFGTMLDFLNSPDYARAEIEAAIDFRRLWTNLSSQLIRRVAGHDFRTDWQDGEDMHENLHHEYIVNFVPNMVDTNPGVEVQSYMLPDDHEGVVAIQQGLQGWVKRTDLASVLVALANDVCYDFAVGMVSLTDVPGYDEDADDDSDRWDLPAIMAPGRPMWPRLDRISPRRYFKDPISADSRFMGHIWVRDKQDLLDAKNDDGSPKFDAEAVNALSNEVGVEEVIRDTQGEYSRSLQGPARKQVVGYEWYCPETGLLYTMGYVPTASSGDGAHAFLRKPRPFIGIRRGPYVEFGINIIPDQIYPLSPLAVTASLVREIEAHSGQASEDAASAKRLVILDSNSKTLQNKITTEANGSVICAPGFTGQWAAAEFGGAQPANLAHIQSLKERWERMTGINDTIRGNITGATATETNLAQQSSDVRTRFGRRMFQASVVKVLEAAAYLMHESNAVRFFVKVPDPATGQTVPRLFVGGPQPGMEFMRFEDLEFRIQPYSMEYVDESVKQRRMQMAGELVLNALPAAMQFPFFKVREYLDDAFNVLNIPDAGRRYIDFAMLDQMRGLAVANQQAQTLAATSGAMAEAGGQQPGAGSPQPGTPVSRGGIDPNATGADGGNPNSEYASMLAEAAGV